MKLFELKLGRLYLKVENNKLLLFAGSTADRKRDLHFTLFFEPRGGKLRPHFSAQGEKPKFLGFFSPIRVQKVMQAFEQELVDDFLKVAKRVEPESLEQDGWLMLCPDVIQREWTARLRKSSETLSITEEALKDVGDVAQMALRPMGMLHQVTSVAHPHPIGAVRVTEDGECSESAFIYYFPDGLNDAPGWYLVPQSLFSRQRLEELMLRHFPAKVWELLLRINDRLGLKGDRERILRFARFQR